MNPLKLLKIYEAYNKLQDIQKENVTVNSKLTQSVTLIASLVGVIGVPELATKWLHTHELYYAIAVGALILLHAIFPSIFAAPSKADTDATGYTKPLSLIILVLLLGSTMAMAQTPAAPLVTAPMQNLYAAGVSYNVGATPAVAGTGLYAHIVANTGTYAFTAIDALPNTYKPFTVTTNIGVGIAQKVVTIANIPIYIPAATGISFSGSNTGWQWNTGAMASVHLKGDYYLLPTVRLVKSSVSGGTGYQPIIGVLFGWGN